MLHGQLKVVYANLRKETHIAVERLFYRSCYSYSSVFPRWNVDVNFSTPPPYSEIVPSSLKHFKMSFQWISDLETQPFITKG